MPRPPSPYHPGPPRELRFHRARADGHQLQESGCDASRSVPSAPRDWFLLGPWSTFEFRIGDAPRHCQLNFRTTGCFAPNLQTSLNRTGPLLHSGNSPMSVASAVRQDTGVHTDAIISHSQPQNARIVADVQFDTTRLRMPERIDHSLSENAIEIFFQTWMKFPWRSLHQDAKRRLGRSILGIGEFLSQRCKRLEQVVPRHLVASQCLNRIPAFGNCLCSPVNRDAERLLGLFWFTRKQVLDRLEPQH